MKASEEHAISDDVVELTDTTLDEAIHGAGVPVLVHFRAPWCANLQDVLTYYAVTVV